MVKKNKRAKTQAPAKAERPPLWNHRLFPLVFFLALSLLYFYEVSAVGQDRLWYGRGDGLPQGRGSELLGQGADCGPADVGSQDGRLSPV